jgi:hypothetical protein
VDEHARAVGTDISTRSQAVATAAPLSPAPATLAASYRFQLDTKPVVQVTGFETIFKGGESSLVQYQNTGGAVGWTLPSSALHGVGWPTSAQHEQMARDYLIGVGVPAEELGRPTTMEGRESSFAVAEPRKTTEASLGVSTNFTRMISGVRVTDSFASARLNANGVPVDFGVSWPPVPAEILTKAIAMKGRVVTPPLGAGYDVEVVIRDSRHGRAELKWVAAVRNTLRTARHSSIDTDEAGNKILDFEPGPPPGANMGRGAP